MLSSFFAELSYEKEHASKANRRIARFLLEHTERVETHSLSELAEETQTSYATVSRFFRRWGGYKTFRVQMRGKRQEETLSANAYEPKLSEDAPYEVIARQIHAFTSAVILGAKTDRAALQKAVELLCDAQAVCVAGLGTSAVAAHYAYIRFSRLDILCQFDTDMILTKMRAALLREKQVLFAISSSGRMQPIVEAAKLAKANGASVIALCDFANTPLAGVADVAFCTTPREACGYVDPDAPLLQEQLTLLDVLDACLRKEKGAFSFWKTKHAVVTDRPL